MELVIVGIVAFFLGWMFGYQNTNQRKEALRLQEMGLRAEAARSEQEIAAKHKASRAELEAYRRETQDMQTAEQQEFERLLRETRELKSELGQGFLRGRQWLANAFSEYIQTRDLALECALVVKPNPAWKAAEAVASLRSKRVEMARDLKFKEYQLASYEEYFPFLVEYRDAILDEAVDLRADATEALTEVDPSLGLGYLSKQEYESLSSTEKFQLALDRYWQRDKSSVAIGRLYERYIGYLYEGDGWNVQYHGALEGFEDFGRDLICTKDGQVRIVQCKCWSKSKVIREKHIMQLFGTTILYRLSERQELVQPVFVATTNLSNEAAMVAKELGVEVRYQELQRYPMIKCNINPATGERIFHLPFDQQYDRVVIGNQPGESYVATVQEAEAAGFRRAHRWQGNNAEGS